MFSFTKAGKPWNEDRVYVCNEFGFVLDGASSIVKKTFSNLNSDAEFAADWWFGYLKDALKNMKLSIPEILKAGVGKYVLAYNKLLNGEDFEDFPSTTISIVRKINEKLEFYSLGNSPIIFKTKTGITFMVVDPLNDVVDNINASVYKKISLEENISVSDARKKYPDNVSNMRKQKNTFGGYYILANSTQAIEHGVYNFIDHNLIEKVLILSDGYSQVFDTVGFLSIEKLIDKINTPEDAEKIYSKLYKYQEKDPGGNKYIRFKKRDDASLVCMKF